MLNRKPCRETRQAAFGTILLAVLAALSGCHTGTYPGGAIGGPDFPLELFNNSTATISLHAAVIEGFGRTAVYQSNHSLPPGQIVPIEPVHIPYGNYTLRASTHNLSRETDVVYSETTEFLRFVVLDDVILFQQRS